MGEGNKGKTISEWGMRKRDRKTDKETGTEREETRKTERMNRIDRARTL